MEGDDRDLLVAAALVRLRPPEHGDRFWDDLEHQLSASEIAAERLAALHRSEVVPARSELPPVASTALAGLHGVRQRSPARAGVLAAAAALLVAVSVIAVMQRRGPSADVASNSTTSTGPAPFVPSTATVPVSLVTPGEAAPIDDEPVGPEQAVGAWIEAVARGNTQRAWELLAPRSRGLFSGYQAFANAAPTLASSDGVWASAAVSAITRMTMQVADGTVEVITMSGDVVEAGSTAARAHAFSVRQRPMGRFRIESLAMRSEHIDVTRPDASKPRGATLTSGEGVEAVVPAVDDPVVVSIDGSPGSSVTAVAVKGTAYGRVTIGPASGSWASGRHIVTVAVTRPDGFVLAAAVLFAVAAS